MKWTCLAASPALNRSRQSAGRPSRPDASGLLIVTFDVLWQVMMDHPADVGFVYAHAKGNRRANNPRFISEEKVLVFGAT